MPVNPLYEGALNKRCVTFADRCKSGRGIRPAYLPGTVGLKDVRLSKNAEPHIRVRTNISLSNGSTDASAALREYEQPLRAKKRISLGNGIPQRQINGRNKRWNSEKRDLMKSALYY